MNKRALSLLVVVFLQLVLFSHLPDGVVCQEPTFELPVELIGFPVIVIAVRLSNFVKKLAYSLNPQTYAAGNRVKREISSDEMINMLEAEKRLVTELGNHVCIYPKVCLHHAEKSRKSQGQQKIDVDWEEIFRNYKSTTEKQKEFYLLSVFLGDFIASPRFCNQLVKRGRSCIE